MTDAATGAPLLEFQDVRISYLLRAGELNVVPGLSFTLGRGEALGLVGESGCGKSTVALATMRYLGPAGRIRGGRILFEGRDLATLGDADLCRIRGRRIAMIYQDPMASLNPVMTVGRQLMEVPMTHEGVGPAEARRRALRMLAEVKIPDAEAVLGRYPHQLSGGQQQRIVIAMALIAEPALLIMDEPTTGLDVTVEAAVLDLVRDLRQRIDAAILFISHNLGTVVRVCDRIGVMYAGELIEEGTIRTVFANPRHPYTRGLLDCLPALGRDKRQAPLVPIPGQLDATGVRPRGCVFAARCVHVVPARCESAPIPSSPVGDTPGHHVRCVRANELAPWRRLEGNGAATKADGVDETVLAVERLRKVYRPRRGLLGSGRRVVQALHDVDLAARSAKTLAIVGESGCGKSTFARVLSGLETATAGTATLGGTEIGGRPIDSRPVALRRQLQMVFQNPDSTLNPSHTAGHGIVRALQRLRGLGRAAARREAERLFTVVKLPPEFADRKPHQLSGGQRQRVAIARALAGEPERDRRRRAGLGAGRLGPGGDRQSLERAPGRPGSDARLHLARPVGRPLPGRSRGGDVSREDRRVRDGGEPCSRPRTIPYTEALLSAVPIPDPEAQRPRIVLEGPLPSASERPAGCPFSTRCPRKVGQICDDTPPPGADPRAAAIASPATSPPTSCRGCRRPRPRAR